MKSIARRFATLTLAATALAAWGTAQPVEARSVEKRAPGICRPEAAQALTGRKRISHARARRLTGASIVRQLKPDQPATMDYRRERVTIVTDPRTGRIVRAMCG